MNTVTQGTAPAHCGCPGCMTPDILAAFLDHHAEAVRRQVIAEYEAAERWKWAPVAQWVRAVASAPTWAETLRRRRALKAATPVRQTSGWPPVATPGGQLDRGGLRAA